MEEDVQGLPFYAQQGELVVPARTDEEEEVDPIKDGLLRVHIKKREVREKDTEIDQTTFVPKKKIINLLSFIFTQWVYYN